MKNIDEKIKEIMQETFDEVLDEYAPKQPAGSVERKIGLVVGATIIAKTLLALPTLIQKEREEAVQKFTEIIAPPMSYDTLISTRDVIIVCNKYLSKLKGV